MTMRGIQRREACRGLPWPIRAGEHAPNRPNAQPALRCSSLHQQRVLRPRPRWPRVRPQRPIQTRRRSDHTGNYDLVSRRRARHMSRPKNRLNRLRQRREGCTLLSSVTSHRHSQRATEVFRATLLTKTLDPEKHLPRPMPIVIASSQPAASTPASICPLFLFDAFFFQRAKRAVRSFTTENILLLGPFFYGLFIGLPALIFDVWIRPPLLIINHSI